MPKKNERENAPDPAVTGACQHVCASTLMTLMAWGVVGADCTQRHRGPRRVCPGHPTSTPAATPRLRLCCVVVCCCIVWWCVVLRCLVACGLCCRVLFCAVLCVSVSVCHFGCNAFVFGGELTSVEGAQDFAATMPDGFFSHFETFRSESQREACARQKPSAAPLVVSGCEGACRDACCAMPCPVLTGRIVVQYAWY